MAPIGYPHRKPAKTAKEPYGDTPKSRQNTGLVRARRRSMAFVESIRLQIRIKGNSVGRTVLNHKSSPLLAPVSTGAGKMSMEKNSRMRERGREIPRKIRALSGITDLRIKALT